MHIFILLIVWTTIVVCWSCYNKYPQTGSLNNRNYIPVLKVWNQGVIGLDPSEGSAGEFVPCVSLWPLAVVKNPCSSLGDVLLYSLSLSSRVYHVLPCGYASLCPNFIIRTQVIWDLGRTLINYDLILTWLHLQIHYFKIRSHLQALGGRKFL